MVADVAATDAAKAQKRMQKKARKDGVSAGAGKCCPHAPLCRQNLPCQEHVFFQLMLMADMSRPAERSQFLSLQGRVVTAQVTDTVQGY